MDLENKTCSHCTKEFRDGDFLSEYENKYYHHIYINNSKNPRAMPCSILKPKNKSGIFYNNQFYYLDERLRKIILKGCETEYIGNEKEILIGQRVLGDISFLNNFSPD